MRARLDTNLLAGFDEYYRTTLDEQLNMFESSVIVFDTNVLLNVLRYSETARHELLDAIASVADRAFVPHQVAAEFTRNRVEVVASRRSELDDLDVESAEIRKSVSALTKKLRRRRIVGEAEVEKLEMAAEDFLAVLNAAFQEAVNKYDLKPDSLVGVVDEWTRCLDQALSNRVADAPPAETREEDTAEANRRQRERLAPGFKDTAIGDYLWWAEALRWPDIVDKHLFVVSDDAKKGDWRFEQRGLPAGPQPILIDDARRAGARSLTLFTTAEFLKLLEGRGQTVVSESTIAESEQVESRGGSPWSFEAYRSLVYGLWKDGYGDRVRVIRTAARNGGKLSRDDVYQIADIKEEDRSLRHFATPALRHARTFERSHDEDWVLRAPLNAFYEGPGKAVGYEVPPEFVEFELRMDFLPEAAPPDA